MLGNRGQALRSVHQVLETYEPLRAYLKHTKGAPSLEGGARILGDDIRINDLPLPSVVLTFGGGAGNLPSREDMSWLVQATIYARTVFEAADVLDHIEDCARSYSYNHTLPQPLNRFHVESHETLDAVGPAGRIIAVRVNLEITWISN